MLDPSLQAAALRYAAGDLAPDEAAAFEVRLAENQGARDALAEAVRLSARAIGQEPPAPHPSFRGLLRERLGLRAYRGSPLAWAALGAASVAACTLLGLALAGGQPDSAHSPAPPAEVGPVPRAEPRGHAAAAPVLADAGSHVAAEPAEQAEHDPHSVAEIWAELSSHEGVEKARDDEARWRHRVRDLSHPHVLTGVKSSAIDVHKP